MPQMPCGTGNSCTRVRPPLRGLRHAARQAAGTALATASTITLPQRSLPMPASRMLLLALLLLPALARGAVDDRTGPGAPAPVPDSGAPGEAVPGPAGTGAGSGAAAGNERLIPGPGGVRVRPRPAPGSSAAPAPATGTGARSAARLEDDPEDAARGETRLSR